MHADVALGEAEQQGVGVVHGPVVVHGFDQGAHLGGLAAEIEQHLDAVHGHLHHGAADLGLDAPVARVHARQAAVVGARADDAANAASGDQLMRFEHLGKETAPVRDAEFDTSLLTGGDHLPAFTRVVSHRFFADHVLAAAGGFDRVRAVDVGGSGHDHRVDLRVVEQFFDGAVRRAPAEALGELPSFLQVAAADRGQVDARGFEQAGSERARGDGAAADDAETEFFHTDTFRVIPNLRCLYLPRFRSVPGESATPGMSG